jgi:hypothetical protein
MIVKGAQGNPLDHEVQEPSVAEKLTTQSESDIVGGRYTNTLPQVLRPSWR